MEFKHKWGPTGIVNFPTGKMAFSNGVISTENPAEIEFLKGNSNFEAIGGKAKQVKAEAVVEKPVEKKSPKKKKG